MSDLYNRIDNLCKTRGTNITAMCKETGITRSIMSELASGRTKTLSSPTLSKLSNYFDVSIEYLSSGEDIKKDPSHEAEVEDYSEYPNIFHLPFTKKVPLVGNIACGEPILADENIEGYIDAPEDVEADFCLRCRGDSMIGARILDGDIVFIRSQNDVDDGEIAAVLIDSEATLKRVYKLGDRLELRAENPHFPRMVYQGLELADVRIIGKAVAFLSEVR